MDFFFYRIADNSLVIIRSRRVGGWKFTKYEQLPCKSYKSCETKSYIDLADDHRGFDVLHRSLLGMDYTFIVHKLERFKIVE